MGRLFWKFFAAILVTQMLTVGAVGFLFWLHEPGRHMLHPMPPPGGEPMPLPGRRPFLLEESHPPPPPPFPGERPPRHRDFPLLPLGVGVVFGLIFAFLLARNMAKPIEGLRRALGAVAKGRFDVRLGPALQGRKDELAQLSRDFDRTAEQLDVLLNSQRRLLHDVSHEIRSPLARIQLAIDLAQQQPDKEGASLVRIQRESERIERLVDELLTLSRLEVGAYPLHPEPVDVGDLLRDVAADAAFEAERRHCRVSLEVAGDMTVSGCPELLLRAFENVIRNAIRYTFDGTEVGVQARREGARLVVEVADDGPGIPEAALKSIFDPFVRFREDRGRRDGDEQSGYGLGLAITQQVIQAHGGTIRGANRRSGGLVIRIELPTQAEGTVAGEAAGPQD